MKNKILILTILITLFISSLSFAQGRDLEVYIDGTKLQDDEVNFFLKEDRTFLPIRTLSDFFDYELDFNDEDNSITIKNEDNNLKIKTEEKFFLLNNLRKTMDVEAFIEDGKTYVPIRFIAEAFGKNVIWNEENYSVYIEETVFTGDEKLNSHLDKDIVFNNFLNEPVGATAPSLYYGNKDYSVVFNYNGILVVENETGTLKGAIDNRALGLNLMEGDEVTKVYGNDDNMLFISNDSEKKSGYVYSIENDLLKHYDDVSHFDFQKANFVDPVENGDVNIDYNSEEAISYSMIRFGDGFSHLETNWDDLGDSNFTILNEGQKEIIQFRLSSIHE